MSDHSGVVIPMRAHPPPPSNPGGPHCRPLPGGAPPHALHPGNHQNLPMASPRLPQNLAHLGLLRPCHPNMPPSPGRSGMCSPRRGGMDRRCGPMGGGQTMPPPPPQRQAPFAMQLPGHHPFTPQIVRGLQALERLRGPTIHPSMMPPRLNQPQLGNMLPTGSPSPGMSSASSFPLGRTPCTFPIPSPLGFSQEDLDMVLYGYAKNRVNEHLPGHALSGLRIGELSYGIDRILSGCGPPVSRAAMVTVDPTTLDLPEGLELFQTSFAGTVHYGVFCRRAVISKGTRFGPFQGKIVNTSEIKTNDDNSFMWEIFADGKLSHFVDGRGGTGNWMAYVNCARYAQEQNLIAMQVDGDIFYEACKDIAQGTELLVWYGDCYLQFMGIPVALKDMADGTATTEIENSEGYQCERCGKVFAYKYYRDKHLKYTRCVDQGDRKFPCHICTRSFEKRDRLRIHILHVHEKHRPHKCNVCGKSFSQSSSLNKHMRVHSGERPYKCVYCSKAFTASSILRTHIRQHSGEKPFKCKHCGKAFASHAAHDSHVRRTHSKEKPSSCPVCGKVFSLAYELKFHMRTHDMQHVKGESISRGDINMNDKFNDDPIDVGTEVM